jgi:hypothetical protein
LVTPASLLAIFPTGIAQGCIQRSDGIAKIDFKLFSSDKFIASVSICLAGAYTDVLSNVEETAWQWSAR